MESLRLLALPAALTTVWVLMAGASGDRLPEPNIEQPLPAPPIQLQPKELPGAPVA